jgi:hypothetical protein
LASAVAVAVFRGAADDADAAAGAAAGAEGGGTFDRLRITVSVSLSSTRLSWRSRVSDRRTRSASRASRCDIWFAASIPSDWIRDTSSAFARPSSLASS